MLQSKDNDIKMNQVSPRLKDIIREADRKCNETRGVYDYILAELIIKECATIGRNYILATNRLNDYHGTVYLEQEILKLLQDDSNSGVVL